MLVTLVSLINDNISNNNEIVDMESLEFDIVDTIMECDNLQMDINTLSSGIVVMENVQMEGKIQDTIYTLLEKIFSFFKLVKTKIVKFVKTAVLFFKKLFYKVTKNDIKLKELKIDEIIVQTDMIEKTKSMFISSFYISDDWLSLIKKYIDGLNNLQPVVEKYKNSIRELPFISIGDHIENSDYNFSNESKMYGEELIAEVKKLDDELNKEHEEFTKKYSKMEQIDVIKEYMSKADEFDKYIKDVDLYNDMINEAFKKLGIGSVSGSLFGIQLIGYDGTRLSSENAEGYKKIKKTIMDSATTIIKFIAVIQRDTRNMISCYNLCMQCAVLYDKTKKQSIFVQGYGDFYINQKTAPKNFDDYEITNLVKAIINHDAWEVCHTYKGLMRDRWVKMGIDSDDKLISFIKTIIEYNNNNQSDDNRILIDDTFISEIKTRLEEYGKASQK